MSPVWGQFLGYTIPAIVFIMAKGIPEKPDPGPFLIETFEHFYLIEKEKITQETCSLKKKIYAAYFHFTSISTLKFNNVFPKKKLFSLSYGVHSTCKMFFFLHQQRKIKAVAIKTKDERYKAAACISTI